VTALLSAHSVTSLDVVHHADALSLLRGLRSASVDLIATDPPYNMRKFPGDTFESDAALVRWLGVHFAEMRRVLKPNGSVYVFTWPSLADLLSVEMRRHFNVLSHVVWRKDQGRHKSAEIEGLRAFFPQSERIILAEQRGADSMALGESQYAAACDELRGFVFEPLRAYLDDERERAGISFEQVRQIVECAPGSGLPSHWFTRSQWALPTEDNYLKLRAGFNALGNGSGEYLRREYEDLRREYEDLRRPFNATPDAPYTDVWDFPTVGAYPGRHPTEKPLAMMRHIVRVSSRPGAVVLDPFCGSGTTLLAAYLEGRQYIGGDFAQRWVHRSRQRIAEHTRPMQAAAVQHDDVSDLPLFAAQEAA